MTGIESCRKGDKRMKQAEHPPVTAGANSAAEYSLAIIDQLARIDRTCSKEEMDELVYRLLAFVGGHLGSARENLRMLTLLEEKQKSLEQNLQAVKLEQQMLKVLCRHHVRLPRGSDERPGRDRQDRGALQLRGRPAPARAIMRRLQASGGCTG